MSFFFSPIIIIIIITIYKPLHFKMVIGVMESLLGRNYNSTLTTPN